jgi:hypothetical protein
MISIGFRSRYSRTNFWGILGKSTESNVMLSFDAEAEKFSKILFSAEI